MKSSKYTQATDPVVLDPGKEYTVSGSSSNRSISRTFSDGHFQNVNNSEELLLKGSYDEYNPENMFEMQRYSPDRNNPPRYLVAGQDFELICNCAVKEFCAPKPRTSQLHNSEQNIVLTTNR